MIDLLSDLCTRIIRWRSQTVEFTVLSLILWVLILLAVVATLSYLDASILGVS